MEGIECGMGWRRSVCTRITISVRIMLGRHVARMRWIIVRIITLRGRHELRGREHCGRVGRATVGLLGSPLVFAVGISYKMHYVIRVEISHSVRDDGRAGNTYQGRPGSLGGPDCFYVCMDLV